MGGYVGAISSKNFETLLEAGVVQMAWFDEKICAETTFLIQLDLIRYRLMPVSFRLAPIVWEIKLSPYSAANGNRERILSGHSVDAIYT